MAEKVGEKTFFSWVVVEISAKNGGVFFSKRSFCAQNHYNDPKSLSKPWKTVNSYSKTIMSEKVQ